MILQLVQDPRNLEYFLEHDTMLTALTRILNEDHKKSVDLVRPTHCGSVVQWWWRCGMSACCVSVQRSIHVCRRLCVHAYEC
jgi:hypothetical protein